MILDENMLLLLNESFRYLLFTAPAMAMEIAIFTTMLERRRSLACYIFAAAMKVLVSNILTDVILWDYFNQCSWWAPFSGTVHIIFSLVAYAVIVYTYYGGFAKCVVGVWVMEMAVVAIVMLTTIPVNWLEHRENLYSPVAVLEPLDLLQPVLIFAIVLPLYHYTTPFLKKYRTFQFKRSKLWAAAVVVYTLYNDWIIIQESYSIRLQRTVVFPAISFMLVLMLTLSWIYRSY